MNIYLKANRNNTYTLMNIGNWFSVALSIKNVKVYLVCDDRELIDTLRKEFAIAFDYIEIIPSARDDEVLKEFIPKVISPNWYAAAYAHLTTFLHAKASGCDSFWNIDADDTYIALSPERAAEMLCDAERKAKEDGIRIFSLDMHVSKLAGKHWSFGITYTDNRIDWFKLMDLYIDEYKEMKDVLNDRANIDWYFTYLRHNSNYKIESFYAENLRFAHFSGDMMYCCDYAGVFYWENGRLIAPVLRDIMGIPLIGDIPIPPIVIRLDTKLSKEEGYEYIQMYAGKKRFSELKSSNIEEEICEKLEPFLKQKTD